MTAPETLAVKPDGERCSAGARSAPRGSMLQLVSFSLAGEEYGLAVYEIILPGPITAIPEAPDYIRGMINLRG